MPVCRCWFGAASMSPVMMRICTHSLHLPIQYIRDLLLRTMLSFHHYSAAGKATLPLHCKNRIRSLQSLSQPVNEGPPLYTTKRTCTQHSTGIGSTRDDTVGTLICWRGCSPASHVGNQEEQVAAAHSYNNSNSTH